VFSLTVNINSDYARKKTKEKIGVEYSLKLKWVQQKAKKTHMENTGYSNPLKNPETVKKMKKTKIEKYGSLLNPMARYKNYYMPSGKVYKIQGNEPQALDLLLEKFEETDIFISRKEIEKQIGKIFYDDSRGKSHEYYPDIYIKSENKIIEVKSGFTYNMHKNINILKKEACISKGLNFDFFIIN
jgi:hypothetical protein